MLRLDPTDPRKTKVQTRDGREAEIYAVKEGQERPIIGAINCGGRWCPVMWGKDGSYYFKDCGNESENDLVNAPDPPVTVERWVMLYRDGTGYYVTLSKRAPDQIPDADRIAAKKIEIAFTPGVFE